MAQTEMGEIRNVLRALVPLSALPLLWKDLGPEAIAESLASVLVKTLDADFVYLAASTPAHVLELACGRDGRVPPALIPAIRKTLPGSSLLGRGQIHSALSGDVVTLLSTPLRLENEAALVVASKRSDFPSGIDRLILRMAANEATAAIEREESRATTRNLAKLVELSSNFIGLATLQGAPLYVNPAGLKLVGMTSIEEALAFQVVDFLEPCDRDRARYEVWPAVLSEGRWNGQLSFLNAKTGTATPLLVESFRIDNPTAEPLAIGTISVDLRKWNRAELSLVNHQRLANTHQVMSALARVEGLSVRERQVLNALVAGRSHKIIAHDLGISIRTVEAHRSRMMRHLGVRTLAEAIKLAMTSGAVQ